MFTGIVEAVGRIADARPREGGLRLMIDASALDTGDVAIGDSVAIAGCCLTIVAVEGSVLAFDVSQETLRCTHGLAQGQAVNLETALRLGERLGGHLVSGHVDGVGMVTRMEPPPGDPDSRLLEVEAPAELARFIAVKGSIAVDGVSLTVNRVAERRFAVNLIPHSLAVTTLGSLVVGAKVNLEADLVARYVERLSAFGR
jgi:riboflavin synthase